MTYSVTVTDANTGCEAIVDFVLTDDVAAALVTSSDNALACIGDENGTANYNVTYETGFVEPATIVIRDG